MTTGRADHRPASSRARSPRGNRTTAPFLSILPGSSTECPEGGLERDASRLVSLSEVLVAAGEVQHGTPRKREPTDNPDRADGQCWPGAEQNRNSRLAAEGQKIEDAVISGSYEPAVGNVRHRDRCAGKKRKCQK